MTSATLSMTMGCFLALLPVACSGGAAGDDSAAGASTTSEPQVRLTGHVPAWVARARDLGPLPPDQPLNHLTVVLARSREQQRAWDALLAAQQTPGSADYHRWLSPEDIAARFGATQGDLSRVQAWLESHGLQVDGVSRDHSRVTFSGTAANVGAALSTEFHRFDTPGSPRISVISEPMLPASLVASVRLVAGLSTAAPSAQGRGIPGQLSPDYTAPSGKHYLVPADFTAIYDLGPVYAEGLDGAGETIAIAGRSRVTGTDISEFQQEMGLPVVAPTVIVPSTGIDPGVTGNGDQLEATIDVTRAGSVAPGATIDLVVSGTPSGSMLNGLAIAVEYAVDNDTAPILSISFYECEQNGGTTWTDFYDTLFQQAAAEGMSVFVCAGDSGAAGCDTDDETPPATQFLNPNYICASGSATCVGGTEFADVASPSTYWNATNSTGMGSAKGTIPEGAWNEPLNASNEPTIWAGGGGVSTIITKPAWQAGTGVPADGFRDTPDIAFSSSAHDGYFACYASGQGNCAINEFEYVFGTSAAAPSMAGILAIADQKAGMAQGNVNQLLYTLAAGPAAAQVFHDVTVATSGVASCTGLPSMCNNSTPGTAGLSGGLVGYTVGAGFDLATGWGSLDVAHFIETFGCVGAADGTTCNDGDACTLMDACHGGLCSGTPVVCTAQDSCHAVGTCSPATGQCTDPNKPDGTSCSSGDLCSPGACEVGVCTGTPVVCMPMDSCHTAGTCSMTTGQCSNPAKPDGSSCSGGGTCASGVCLPPSGGDAGPDAGNGDAGGGSRDSGSATDSGNLTFDSGSASDGGNGSGPGQPSGCGCKIAGQSEERGSPLGGAMVALVVFAVGRRRGTRSTRHAVHHPTVGGPLLAARGDAP